MSVKTFKEVATASLASQSGLSLSSILQQRRLPVGAEFLPDGAIHFRVWAPRAGSAEVELQNGPQTTPELLSLQPEGDGYFSGQVRTSLPAPLYKVRLERGSFPDPASRYQPDGPHGPSQVVKADGFAWTDAGWKGPEPGPQVIYEMHIGTFTPEGTWAAAATQLPSLAELGVTLVEVMPVADFTGRFGWGYDGVNLFAPTRLYGTPDDFRAFVDRAHQQGIGVILDVVYNHFGPDGNYLKEFSPDYFTDRYANEWGEAINFDGPNSGPVREFFIANAGYWIDEYHLDGLRLDATQQIFDASSDHILAALTRRIRSAAGGRGTFIVAENEPQHTRLVRASGSGGYGIDALWNDDFHHSAVVASTGKAEAYYSDYRGTPQEFISALKWGYLFQGQRYRWQKQRRGTRTDGLEPTHFVNYLQNHDQVANSLRGLRGHLLASPGCWRALTALLLLGPGSVMLFQGQEFAASTPFFYFADHNPDLAKLVAKGRQEFLCQFPSLTCLESQRLLTDPAAERTFHRSKLSLAERDAHAEAFALHRDLIRLRREDSVLRNPQRGDFDGAVLGPEAFLLRFFGDAENDRLLLINFGADLRLDPAPEPLLAPMDSMDWKVQWSSDDAAYGGCGVSPLQIEGNLLIPGQSATLLVPAPPVRGHGKNHSQT